MNLLLSMPGGAEWTLILIACFVLIVPYVLFLITLQNTLKAISPENRKMPPGNVWLMFIPLFNIVWLFIMIGYIADSIKAECNRLNIPSNENRPTYNLGLGYAICSIAGSLLSFIHIGTLIFWIMYWVKVNEYKNLIIANKDNYQLDIEREQFHKTSPL